VDVISYFIDLMRIIIFFSLTAAASGLGSLIVVDVCFKALNIALSLYKFYLCPKFAQGFLNVARVTRVSEGGRLAREERGNDYCRLYSLVI
jgi:hypothetical protein